LWLLQAEVGVGRHTRDGMSRGPYAPISGKERRGKDE
jgi:hypothetical protein